MGSARQLETGFEKHIEVELVKAPGEPPLKVYGGHITPRGVVLQCTPEQVSVVHDLGDQQAKFESMGIRIQLVFGTGEIAHLSSDAQIQNIRRVSQKEYDVEIAFHNMMADGYRHISRYLVSGQQPENV